MSDHESDNLFRSGQYDAAAQRLLEGFKKHEGGNDELLYILDAALAFHTGGNFEESNKWSRSADYQCLKARIEYR
jgi:hypothetical protein